MEAEDQSIVWPLYDLVDSLDSITHANSRVKLSLNAVDPARRLTTFKSFNEARTCKPVAILPKWQATYPVANTSKLRPEAHTC